MNKTLHPSPYTGLESCEICWADEEETEIILYKDMTLCQYDLDSVIDSERGK